MSGVNFLMVRGSDLLVLGVDWVNFRLDWPGFESMDPFLVGRPRMVAAPFDAAITLTFPPQAIAEDRWPPAAFSGYPEGFDQLPEDVYFRGLEARMSGPSRLKFRVSAGASFELNSNSLLTMLADTTKCRLDSNSTDTFLEIPWRLYFSLTSSTGAPIKLTHPADPVTSPAGVTRLWQTQLCATDGDRSDARLLFNLYRPRPSEEDALSQSWPSRIDRDTIYRPEATERRATVKRLDLSALGATCSLNASWPDFQWEQDIVLGRDERVKTVVTGRLFPFGFPAIITTITKRNFRILPLPFNALYEWIEDEEDPSVHNPTPPGHHAPDRRPGHFELRVPTNQRSRLATLEAVASLRVIDPVRTAGPGALWDLSQFPFDRAELLQTDSLEIQVSGDECYIVKGRDGRPKNFQVHCTGRPDGTTLSVPLVFVRDGYAIRPGIWSPQPVSCGGISLDVVRNVSPQPNDTITVYEMQLGFNLAADSAGRSGLYAKEFTAKVPALGRIYPDYVDSLFKLEYLPKTPNPLLQASTENPLLQASTDYALSIKDASGNPVLLDFTGDTHRSGCLIAPKFNADVISRVRGPAPSQLENPTLQTLKNVFSDSAILGIGLTDLIPPTTKSPEINTLFAGGRPDGASMTWVLDLWTKTTGSRSFEARPSLPTTLHLKVKQSSTINQIECDIADFNFNMPSGAAWFLSLRVGALRYQHTSGAPPKLSFDRLSLGFDRELKFFENLAIKFSGLLGASGLTVRPQPNEIAISYTLGLTDVPIGAAFILQNVSAHLNVAVPYSKGDLTLLLAFGSRDRPFAVAVSLLGGGGYIEVGLHGDKVTSFEASFDFGGLAAVDLGIVVAEVHALGGIRFSLQNGDVAFSAFVLLGGSVELLHVVSVDVNLRIDLTLCLDDQNRPDLAGEASMSIEIGVPLIPGGSGKVTLDTGVWHLRQLDLLGVLSMAAALEPDAEPSAVLRPEFPAEPWLEYCNAFRSAAA